MERTFIVRWCARLISLSFMMGMLAFNPGITSGSPDEQGALLSATNEQITLLYIDALNLYKEGKYVAAVATLERIKGLLKADPYVSQVRRQMQIQPTDSILSQFIGKLKQKDIDYQTAVKELNKGNYAHAKEVFTALAQDSPQSLEIPKYLRLVEDREARDRLNQERMTKISAAEKRKEELRKAKFEEEARQKQELMLQKEKEAQERQAEKSRQLTKEEQVKQERLRQKEEHLQAINEVKEKQKELRKAQLEELARQKQALKAQKEKEAQERGTARLEKIKQQEEAKLEKARKLALEREERSKQLELERQARKEKELALKKQKDEELAIRRRAQQQLQEELAAQRQQKAVTREVTAAASPIMVQASSGIAAARPKIAATATRPNIDMQEKALGQAKINKQQEDQHKIAMADKLWVEARRLYKQGMYAEAIKDFQEIIKIEGNPRIKYTPSAQEYIKKAQDKLDEEKAQEKTEKLDKQVDTIENEMIDEVKERQIPPYIEPPQRIEKSEEAPLVEPPEVRKKLRKKVSLDFDKVDLKSVMLFLSQESGVNFIASQKVLDMAPKINARFTDTPVDEVIKYLTKNLGLVYRIDKDIVWIAHPEEIAQEALETRIYYLSRGGGLYTQFSPMSSGSDTGLGGSSSEINKVTTIEDTLKEIVPWPQDAKLTYDKRLNALIVRNTPQNLQILEDIIYNLDITPCQILIEAKFLEVDVTDTKEFGITWQLNEDFPVQEKNGQFSHGFAKESGSSFTNAARVAEGLNFTYKGVLTTPQFQTVLHALEESKKIKTLSSPRITTLNNQVATIKVVDEWIYPTRYEYEIVQFDLNGDGDFNDAGETTFKNVPKDFLRRDVGILLKVIPSVGGDKKTISLSLIPEVSEATADGFTYTGDVTLPKFTSRNLSTSVVVNSGDTVVLGGLIKENRTKTTTKVPFFGDLPVVGAFFKKTGDLVERKNLLIFVTAKVMTPSGEEVTVKDK